MCDMAMLPTLSKRPLLSPIELKWAAPNHYTMLIDLGTGSAMMN
jgi:hypothetical protein